jgi:integrase
MLHRAFKDAVAWRYVTYNPAEHASLPRTPRMARTGAGTRHGTWTIEQLAAWLNVALNDRFAGLWLLAATTGMRRSELAGLRRSSLNLDAAQVVTGDDTRVVVRGRAHDSDGKTEASGRTLSLDQLTVEWLRTYIDIVEAERSEFGARFTEDDRLFCYPDGRAPHPQTITRMFNRLADRAGVPRIRLHDVRHTYATLSLNAGIDLKVLSDRLGHANVYVTAQIYGHRSTGHDRQAAESMARLFHRARAQHDDAGDQSHGGSDAPIDAEPEQ